MLSLHSWNHIFILALDSLICAGSVTTLLYCRFLIHCLTWYVNITVSIIGISIFHLVKTAIIVEIVEDNLNRSTRNYCIAAQVETMLRVGKLVRLSPFFSLELVD